MNRRRLPLGVVVWLVIGCLVAASHHYFDNLGGHLGPILSAILAVVLWPLVLLGVKFTITA